MRCYRVLIWFSEKHKAYPRVKYCRAEGEEEVGDIISTLYPNQAILVYDCFEKNCDRDDILTRESGNRLVVREIDT